MPNTKDINLTNKKIKGMIVSPPGYGKTTFMATWPNPFFIDWDGGLGAQVGKDIPYQVFPEPSIKAPTAYRRAESLLARIKKSQMENGYIIYNTETDEIVVKKVGEIVAPLRRIETLCLDGSTAFLEHCMYYMQNVRATQKRPPGRSPDEGDWLPQMSAYKEFISNALSLADLGAAHVWVSTLERIKEIKVRSELKNKNISEEYIIGVKNLPALTGQLATSYGYAFDFVWRIETDVIGGKRRTRILTQTKGIIECKNRYEEAFELYEKPTYENIIGKLSAYFDSKKQ